MQNSTKKKKNLKNEKVDGEVSLKKRTVKEKILDFYKKNKRQIIIYGSVAIIMVIFFGIFYGFHVLKPTYTDWILYYGLDLAQNYLGWRGFRLGKWTFPIIGYTNMLAYPSYTSILYTDSTPILSIFFKLLSPILPQKFQYNGLFGMLCIVLNGIMAARILSKISKNNLNVILGSAIFGVVPSILFRMFYHIDLCAQFLIVLALEPLILYKSEYENNPKKLYRLWIILGSLTVLIHFYFVLMAGIILVGLCIYDILENKRIKRSLYLLISFIVPALLIFFILGGFQSGFESTGYGLGVFSANINSLIDSQHYSSILPTLSSGDGQYEGFGYLGLGSISLAIISLILIVINRKKMVKNTNLFISLAIVFVIAYIFALSPKVMLGGKVLFEIPLPEFIENIWAIFRSTGRVIWIPVYIIMITSAIVICKYIKKENIVTIIFVFALLFQFVDLQNVIKEFNTYYNREFEYNYGLVTTNFWNTLGNDIHYNHVIFVDETDVNRVYPIANFAFDNQLSINLFYFARDYSKVMLENLNDILEKQSDKNIYIFNPSFKSTCNKKGLYCYTVDNYVVGTTYEVDY